MKEFRFRFTLLIGRYGNGVWNPPVAHFDRTIRAKTYKDAVTKIWDGDVDLPSVRTDPVWKPKHFIFVEIV